MLVIWNPGAGSVAENAELRQSLAQRSDLRFEETTDAGHAIRLAAEAVREGLETVAAAGGDGTVHAVLQGLMPDPGRTRLAVIPLGTGNDLCRTLGIPRLADPTGELLAGGRFRRLDVVEMTLGDRVTYFLNVAAGGNGALVSDHLTEEMKTRWGPLCYLRGAVNVMLNLVTYRVAARFDGGPAEQFEALNVVVGNGRACGGGVAASPHANPEDGLLDVVIVLDGSPLDVAVVAAQFVLSDYVRSEHVIFRRARELSLVSEPPLPFSADGDRYAAAAVQFRVLPRALEVLVGHEYQPMPPGIDPLEDE
ncbi:MAG: diacylglycerol kinase family lipid kinase [Planctomycetes bacterium]|nr:diacylglycerol kinase family lipid kinase [Planctomycetota bacterium]